MQPIALLCIFISIITFANFITESVSIKNYFVIGKLIIEAVKLLNKRTRHNFNVFAAKLKETQNSNHSFSNYYLTLKTIRKKSLFLKRDGIFVSVSASQRVNETSTFY